MDLESASQLAQEASAERDKQLLEVDKAERESQIDPATANELRHEIREGMPVLMHFPLARLALLPAFAVWCAISDPTLLPAWVPLLMLPLLPLWLLAVANARPPRTALEGMGHLLAGPATILLVGIIESGSSATLVLLYCVIEVLSLIFGGIVGTWLFEGADGGPSQNRAAWAGGLAILGTPVIIAAFALPQSGVRWSNLTVLDLFAATIAMVGCTLANARARTALKVQVTPVAFRSVTGLAWVLLGLLVFPFIAVVAGYVTRSSPQ